MLEFVDSDLYFVQDKNNFINPLLQVGSGSGSVEKSAGSGWPKITGSGSSSLANTMVGVGGKWLSININRLSRVLTVPEMANKNLATKPPPKKTPESGGLEVYFYCFKSDLSL